jgi:hypothetical protein
VGKRKKNDVHLPHGSLIQIETRRSVEQQAMKRWLHSINRERGDIGRREGRNFRFTRGRVQSAKNKRNSDGMLECTGTEKQIYGYFLGQ